MSHSITKPRLVPVADIERAKDDIVGTISKYIELEKNGSEYRALCPFHSERTASFTVSPDKGIFYCFGCGAGNDAIDFVQLYEDVGFPEAVKIITGGDNVGGAPVKRSKQPAREREDDEWIPVAPIPEDMLLTPMDIWNRRDGDGWQKIKSSCRWAYRDAEGRLLGYTYRFDLPKNPDGGSGGKEIIPQSYCLNTKTGETRWKWLSFGKPRPIYGLEKLAAHPNAQVLVVEGEKTCDAAQVLFEERDITRDKLITVSWPGGGKAAKHVDWGPLVGRSVGLFPDADNKPYVAPHPNAGQTIPFIEQPGTVCMIEIAKQLENIAKSIKFVMPPPGVPDGWDLADPLPEGFELLVHMRTASILMHEFREMHMSVVVPSKPFGAQALLSQGDPEPAGEVRDLADNDDDIARNAPFRILGYDYSELFIYSHKRQQVITTSVSKLATEAGLVDVAGLKWWKENFSEEGKGFKSILAADWITRIAEKRGVYDPGKLRGRGAWEDDGRLVVHLGDRLIVDGESVSISSISSSFVYERRPNVMAPKVSALSRQEGADLLRVARMFRWENVGAAHLLMGWIFLAPICGILKWRPHIWISAGPGVGKSTLMNEFIKPLLPEGCPLHEQGLSTEAALRQKLRADARPVLVDEFEGNTESDRNRIAGLMTLIRISSSSGEVSRGTTSGRAQTYFMSPMFCLASVGAGLDRESDQGRTTRLELTKKEGSTDHWDKLKGELVRVKKDITVSQRLFARTLDRLSMVRASVDVFTKEAGAYFKSNREGDQYGTLLAGCWCLMNDTVPTSQDAQNMLRANDWADLGAGQSSNCDDSRDALNAVLCASTRVKGDNILTVGQLIDIVCVLSNSGDENKPGVPGVTLEDAEQCLLVHGIRVDCPRREKTRDKERRDEVLFADRHMKLTSLIEGTDYVSDLRGRLARLPGARKSMKGKTRTKARFAGPILPYIAVPLGLCLSKDDDEQILDIASETKPKIDSN